MSESEVQEEVLASNDDQNAQHNYSVPDGLDRPSNVPSENDGLNSGKVSSKPEAEYFKEQPDPDEKSPAATYNDYSSQNIALNNKIAKHIKSNS